MELSRTASGLRLATSAGKIRGLGLAGLLFGVIGSGLAVVESSAVGRVHVILMMSPLLGVVGLFMLVFGGVLARRAEVVFDATAGAVRAPGRGKTVTVRAISGVRVAPFLGAQQLQLVLRSGETWRLHSASDRLPGAVSELHAMANQIAQVMGIPRL